MSKLNLEQIKADRAASEKVAPAPWRIGKSKSFDEVTTRVMDANGNTVCDDEEFYPKDVDPLLQERIARLPDLEVLVIEAADVIRVASAVLAGDATSKQSLATALNGARAFMEKLK